MVHDPAVEKDAKASVSEGIGDESRIRVLMYHRIVANDVKADSHQMWLPERRFRRQLEFLDRWGFTAVTFNDYRLFRQGELNLPRKPVILTFDDAYVETYDIVFPILQEFGMKAVIFVVADAAIRTSVWDNKYPAAVTPLMSDAQLLEMHAAGFEIGSHSLTHRNLCAIPPAEAWEEISRSRMRLEIVLNAPVRSFAYPYGLVNEQVKKMIREAGYTIAVAGWTGPALFGEDEFEVRRSVIIRERRLPSASFALSLMSPYQFYRWLWWRIRVFLELSGVKRGHRVGAAK